MLKEKVVLIFHLHSQKFIVKMHKVSNCLKITNFNQFQSFLSAFLTQKSCIHFVYKNCARCIQLMYTKCIKVYTKYVPHFGKLLYTFCIQN